MGQSATLYRIGQQDFQQILNNPDSVDVLTANKQYEVFEKTFAGLQFILSKKYGEHDRELIDQIFYPKEFIGEQIDYANLDYENIPEEFDPLKEPVYFNNPDIVAKIYLLINKISDSEFEKLFNPDELNSHNVYPGTVWNKQIGAEYAFHAVSMMGEFSKLKALFKNATLNNDFLLSYVG
ncbi:MAG: DUF1877 family protein [Chitinophagaceae bacterium]